MKKIIICGFGSAGYSALFSARRILPSSEITVVDPKPYDLFHPCGMPYVLEGLADSEGLSQNINLKAARVNRIQARALSVAEGVLRIDENGSERDLPFDSLIICTGSSPFLPPVKGMAELRGRGLYTLSSLDDLENIKREMTGASSAAVIGGGAIGVETAAALKRSVARVSLYEAQENIFPGIFDSDMALLIEKQLTDSGIDLKTASPVQGIMGNERFTGVIQGGSVSEYDFAVVSAGFRPSIELAENSSIRVSRDGIAVDSRLETSMKNVYAAGDCAAVVSVIDSKPVTSMLATSAYRQGIIAGANAAGGDETYKGTAGVFVTSAAGLEAAGAGFTSLEAERRGFKTVSGKIKARVLPDYFNENHEISIKVIIDSATRKFLGAQAVAPRGAADRINLISAAIEFNADADSFHRLETAYCPAVSEVQDPLFKAVDFALRRIKN